MACGHLATKDQRAAEATAFSPDAQGFAATAGLLILGRA